MNNRFLNLVERPVAPCRRGGMFAHPGKNLARATAYAYATDLAHPDLKWPGATAEQLAFMKEVYRLCYEKSSRGGKKPVRSADLVSIGGGHKLHKDAAAAYLEMKKAIEAAAKAEGVDVKVGVSSSYRTPDHQLNSWQKYFPKYYRRTASARRKAKGGEHGAKAALILRDEVRTYIATPGFSNHQRGVAVDFRNQQDGKVFPNDSDAEKQKEWRSSWLYRWLEKNASKYGFFPYAKEAWHWNYRAPKAGAKALAIVPPELQSLLTRPADLARYLAENMAFTDLTRLLEELQRITHRNPAVPMSAGAANGWAQRALGDTRIGPARSVPVPTIITRSQWGARPYKRGTPGPLGSVHTIVVHHTAGAEATTATGKDQVRKIQVDHQDGEGWSDIGYHFLIDSDGNIYQGRPFLGGTTFGRTVKLAKGAHNYLLNSGQIGISVMGCYDDEDAFCASRKNHTPSTKSLNALVGLIDFFVDVYGLDPTTDIKAHRDYNDVWRTKADGTKTKKATICPGNNLYAKMDDIRRRVKLLASGRARFVPAP